jgi:hypothetical protein
MLVRLCQSYEGYKGESSPTTYMEGNYKILAMFFYQTNEQEHAIREA